MPLALLLQDQLGPAIAAACPEAARFVLSSQALIRGSISAEAAASLSSVLLYGADLQALDVVAALTDAGVSPGEPGQQHCSNWQFRMHKVQYYILLAAVNMLRATD
jgi:hypothetical protein